MIPLSEFRRERPCRGVTIDPRGAVDLDDAIEVRRTAKGWIVVVGIADVADDLEPGSPEDALALRLAETEYRGRSIRTPMLPPAFQQALSLLPGAERPCVAFRMALRADLRLASFRAYRTVFESAARLAYDDVPALLEDDGEIGSMLRSALSIARGLRARRIAGGAWMEEDPDAPGTERRPDDPGGLIVSEMMILANSSAARYAARRRLPVLYRNHAPEGRPLPAGRDGLLAPGAAGNGYAQRASYGVRRLGHKGLGLWAYAHFTSPLRRYADIPNQRALLGIRQPDLRGVAAAINAAVALRSDTRSEVYRSRARETLAYLVRNGGYGALSAAQFAAALSLNPEAVGSDPALGAEIVARASALALGPRDVVAAIMHAPAGSPVARAACATVCDNLGVARQLLSIAESQFGAEAVFERPEKAGRRSVVCVLRRAGRSGVGKASHGRSVDATRSAALQALLDFAGCPEAFSGDLSERRDGDAEMAMLCRDNGWSPPSIEVRPRGSSPALHGFEATAALATPERTYEAVGRGPTARSASARAVRALLGEIPPGTGVPVSAAAAVSTNPTGHVAALTASTLLRKVDAQILASGEDGYACVLHASFGDRPFGTRAYGRSKKDARRNADAALLDEIVSADLRGDNAQADFGPDAGARRRLLIGRVLWDEFRNPSSLLAERLRPAIAAAARDPYQRRALGLDGTAVRDDAVFGPALLGHLVIGEMRNRAGAWIGDLILARSRDLDLVHFVGLHTGRVPAFS